MLVSIAIILLGGYLLGEVFSKIRLPKLIGMILLGILMGPSQLNIINKDLINISSYLRQIALIIILTRAGLSLRLETLKQIGRPSLFLSFLPAILEIIGVIVLAPFLFNIEIIDAILLGSVLAAVSPAIIVPRMIHLAKKGYGQENNIPQIIMAGASLDDIFVITIFSSTLGVLLNENKSLFTFLNIPISIILGVIIGIVIGKALCLIIKKTNINDTVQLLLIFSISILLVGVENIITTPITFASLISVFILNIIISTKKPNTAIIVEEKFNKLWFFFEILLFVLVGVSLDISVAVSFGFQVIYLIFGVLIFRMLGVFLSLIATKLNFKEKLFVMLAYIPKATVQASIGAIALEMGLAAGSLILTVAVVAILITAPLGALLIDWTYKKLILK